MARDEYRLGRLERVVLALGAALLALVSASLRTRVEGEDRLRALVASGRRVIIVSWHGRLLTAFVHFSRYRPAVMISQSRDGARIAWIAERFGFRPVRGSSSRGGVRALLALTRELAAAGGVAIHIVDGPRGPAGEVKPGLIPLAARSGALIVPIYATARWRLEARSWDRMQVPLPWSRIDCRVDEPIEVPARLSESEADALRADLEKRMSEGYRQLEGSPAT
jgi:lysophospholipid acyltransferase (LPLAT)-like uncharacterized protein